MAELNDDVPDCENCSHPEVDLLPQNYDAARIWVLVDRHARDYVGMTGFPMRARLEAIRSECDRTRDPDGTFEKVMLLENAIYPVRYDPDKWGKA